MNVLSTFYNEHTVLCWYYAAINIITFTAFAIDKIKAMMGAWRIREAVLLGLCLLGGGVGGFLAMHICHHKVNSMKFKIGVPVLVCVHVGLMLLIWSFFKSI